MKKRIRLGIIGCGGMSKTHSRGFGSPEIAACMEISAVCDIDTERLQIAKKVTGAEFATTNYKELPDYVDAVLIALPHDLHYEAGVFFARKKKHILMEKPLCNSEAECENLIRIAEEEQVVLMCAYPVRFWPEIQKMKEIAESKVYGDILQMSIWTEQFTKYKEDNWGATARLGGGQFFSHGCHYIDILLWFLGEPDYGTHIGSRLFTPWLMGEGTSNVVIAFKNGAMGYHFGTWTAKGSKMGYDFQIHFEKALVTYSRITGKLEVYEGMDKATQEVYKTQKITEISVNDNPYDKKTQLEILHFISCIHEGKTPLTNAHDALQGLRVIWKLYDAEKHKTMADLSGLGFSK